MAVERPLPVYIVDDDAGIRKSTHFLLGACGYLPSSFASGSDFLESLPLLAPGCVLLDIRMPEVDGIQLLEAVPPALAKHAVIVMTGHGDIAIAVRTMKLGAIDFIEKPFQDDVLVAMLDAAFSGLGTPLNAASRAGAGDRLRQPPHRARNRRAARIAGRPIKQGDLLRTRSQRPHGGNAPCQHD